MEILVRLELLIVSCRLALTLSSTSPLSAWRPLPGAQACPKDMFLAKIQFESHARKFASIRDLSFSQVLWSNVQSLKV
jgi:hypothetical protein